MKSYLLKLNEREEGPFSDGQVAQMFADRRINRSTPCKLATGGDWRTVDEYLPTLKYGTQLPAPTTPVAARGQSLQLTKNGQPVVLVDVDIPFNSLLRIMFKWAAAGIIVACCMLPVFFALWLLVVAVFAGLIGGMLSGLPHR